MGELGEDFDDWTIIVQQRIRQFREGRASNQLQEIINAFMH